MNQSISFIIPAYNCEATIIDTLNSIFNGNFIDGDEVVAVDDCSSDNTNKVLNHYSEHHHPLRIIKHLINRGGAAARNTAVENTKNPLIFCLDSDNILQPSSISRLKIKLLKENAHVAAFQELWYFKNDINTITHKWVFPARQITFADCLASGVVPISSGNYLYTKESWHLAGRYPDFAHALDAWGFGLRQLATGQKMVVLENSGYFHRHGHESYWVRESKQGKISLTALQILLPFIDQLKTSSVNYAMGMRGRNSWFKYMEIIPLRTKSGKNGQGGVILNSKGNVVNTTPLFRKIIVRAKRFFW